MPKDPGIEKSPREPERQDDIKKQSPFKAESGFIAFFSFN